jgi:hypothetical protein
MEGNIQVGCFQHIKHEAGDTDGLYFIPWAYRGILDEAKVRIQVPNLGSGVVSGTNLIPNQALFNA